MRLVIVRDNKPYTSSILLSDGIGVAHQEILRLIRKYKDRKIFQTSNFESLKLPTKGRTKTYYLLNESQAMFIITLMKNSEAVLDFKESLVNAFMEYRAIAQEQATIKKNAEYIEERKSGKLVRKECTDTIKEFVEYAIRQGSTNAARYYSNISKMEINCLFLVEQKYPNMREMLSLKQLSLIKCADEAIQQTLIDGMNENLPYKEIYIKAKEKIELLAKIFPPSPLPQLLMNKEEQQCLTN